MPENNVITPSADLVVEPSSDNTVTTRAPHPSRDAIGSTPVAVVTGGSSGLGLAIAHRLVRQGQAVLLVARDPERLAKTAADLGSVGQGRVASLALDISLAEAPARIDQALAAMNGHADLLVNSAGIGLAGRFIEQDPSALDQLVAVNIAAVTRLCRHVLPGQLTRRRGGIINFASVGAYAPGPFQAAYYASKAYVLSLSEALAAETAGSGVHVTVVAPGYVPTPFHARMDAGRAFYQLMPSADADRVAQAALGAFALGQRVALPGLAALLSMLALRVMPHRLSTALLAFMLAPRRQ